MVMEISGVDMETALPDSPARHAQKVRALLTVACRPTVSGSDLRPLAYASETDRRRAFPAQLTAGNL
jgi:hypothetical protein